MIVHAHEKCHTQDGQGSCGCVAAANSSTRITWKMSHEKCHMKNVLWKMSGLLWMCSYSKQQHLNTIFSGSVGDLLNFGTCNINMYSAWPYDLSGVTNLIWLAQLIQNCILASCSFLQRYHWGWNDTARHGKFDLPLVWQLSESVYFYLRACGWSLVGWLPRHVCFFFLFINLDSTFLMCYKRYECHSFSPCLSAPPSPPPTLSTCLPPSIQLP